MKKDISNGVSRFFGNFLRRRSGPPSGESGLPPHQTNKSFWCGGQSLVEILIAISVGALILGLTIASVSMILKSGSSAKNYAAATSLLQELVDNISVLAERSWANLYNAAPKGATNKFFLMASGTLMKVFPGIDYVLLDDVRSGLIGHWRFDEGLLDKANDYSGNNHLGTIVGTLNWQSGANCVIGNCLSFDGSTQYITIPHNNAFVPTALTMATWIKPNNFSVYTEIISKYSYTAPNFSYQMGLTTGRKVRVDYSINGSTSFNLESQMTLSQGVWSHIVATWDGTKWKIFINGIEDINIVGFTGPLLNVNTSLDIGRISGSNFYMFNGSIDDVRLYNRALSLDEINKIYKRNIYVRYFTIENVKRDSSNDIAAVGEDDPSTQKITSKVEFGNIEPLSNIKLIKFVTRWKSFSGGQSDWSGGPGEEGPVSVDGGSNKFKAADPTVDFFSNPGSLKLKLQ